MNIRLKKAVFVLLYGLTDTGGLELNDDVEYFIDIIIDVSVARNDGDCPYKCYSCKEMCPNFNDCKNNFLVIDCGQEAKKVWEHFIFGEVKEDE